MSRAGVLWQPLPAPAGRLYESARWLPDPGVFQWVDILNASLHRWGPGGGEVEVRALNLEFATVAIPLDHDRSIIASRSSLHEYSWSRETLTTLGNWRFDRDVRFNDGAMSPSGELYIGTMSMDRRKDAGGLFRFIDGKLKEVISGVGISNGLGWTAPNRALYIDSLVPKVHQVNLEDAQPVLSVFAELDEAEEPDGLLVTPGADIIIACWGQGKLIHLSPAGVRLPDLSLPAQFPTSISVGADLIIVTTALVDESDRLTEQDGMVLVADWRGLKVPR